MSRGSPGDGREKMASRADTADAVTLIAMRRMNRLHFTVLVGCNQLPRYRIYRMMCIELTERQDWGMAQVTVRETRLPY